MVAASRLGPVVMLLGFACFPSNLLAGEPGPNNRPLPAVAAGTPPGKLLPTAPKLLKTPVYLGDDLAQVPEVQFEAPEKGGKGTTPHWVEKKAQMVAGILHLNGKEEDGFLKTLTRSRPDLSGLPFLMGKDCRADSDRAKTVKYASEQMHQRAEPSFYFSIRYQKAHIAVMAQNLIAHHNALNDRALTALTSTRHGEATHALARAAVFSPDENLRKQALKALAGRPAGESTDEIVSGLRYPLPSVAQNAARAIVQLKRADLIPQLKAALDEPDPRGPQTAKVRGKTVTVAREVVRINHLRSCTLCHAPADPGKTPEDVLVADIPLPSEPIPEDGGYSNNPQTPSRRANLLVRIDVTYLRQDFSALHRVETSGPWPAMQRFDYVVRKRELTPAEADQLQKSLSGESPYRKAAAWALRELTGREVQAKPRS